MKRIVLLAFCVCLLLWGQVSLCGCAATQADTIDTNVIGLGAITWNAVMDSVIVVQLTDSIQFGVPIRSYEKPTAPGQYIYTLRIDTTYEQITVDLYRRVIDTIETWEPKQKW